MSNRIPNSSVMIEKALKFAYDAHLGQIRKHTLVPYIIHPLDVLRTVASWGVVDPKIRSAALLHDVVEDTGVIVETVEKEFGTDIAKIVDELTFYPEKQDKTSYLASFADASPEAILIKIADRICNTNDFMKTDVAYARKYFNKASVLVATFVNRHMDFDSAVFNAAITERNDLSHRLNGIFRNRPTQKSQL